MQVMLIHAASRLQFSKHLIEMHHDRKRVFVDQLGWRLPSGGSWLEVDEFDNEYTAYLIACAHEDDRHLASVRLLPTTRPHLLNTVFADLCDSGPAVGENIWELSRFMVAPIGMNGAEVMRLSQYLALANVEFALLNEIERYTMVIEAHRVAAVCAMGWRARPLSLPREFNGQKIVAMEVRIEPGTLATMRRRFRISESVLEHAPGMAPS